MNKQKYKKIYYEPRPIRDLKDMINSSEKLFGPRPAFWIKNKHKEPFKPISYSQFKMDILAFGTALKARGLDGKAIAVIGENSYNWVVAYFACAYGLGVVVPIDRELPANEIANLLNRSNAACLCYSDKLSKKINDVLPLTENLNCLVNFNKHEETNGVLSFFSLIDEGKTLISQGDKSFIDIEVDPNAFFALLFTSGTTGMAKGVMVSQSNLVANVFNMSKMVNVDGGRGLSVLPMHHAYEMTCHIFTGLYQGIEIVICEGLKHIQSNMKEMNVTIMLGVPLIFESIHKHIMRQVKAQGKLKKLEKAVAVSKTLKLYNHPAVCRRIFSEVHEGLGGCITHFISGGAAINANVIRDFEAMGFPMFQGYGMAENSPIIAVNQDRCSNADSVGLPLEGTSVKIINVDDDGVGEVICRGPSVMMGYYDNPEATAESLVDGWLHTGDYGYLDDEGYLYITGRKKNVIVTKNGKNVFPEEVEFYLTENEFIEEAMVHEEESLDGRDTVLKAEIFPNYSLIKHDMGKEVTEDEIKDLIQEIVDGINDNMPSYKRIKRVGVRRKEFIKTTVRKIKRYEEENFKSDF